jgi:hypothetical protein
LEGENQLQGQNGFGEEKEERKSKACKKELGIDFRFHTAFQ